MAYRTLGELRDELSASLGFGGVSTASAANVDLLNSLLTRAHYQIYQAFDWADLIEEASFSTVAGTILYDYAADANPERIWDIAASVSDVWTPLTQGIKWRHRTVTTQGAPKRFERRDQIEIWPIPNAIYTVKYFYAKKMASFEYDTDTASVDDNLVFIHALAAGKAHYRQPDANLYADQLNSLLNSVTLGRNRLVVAQKNIQSPDR